MLYSKLNANISSNCTFAIYKLKNMFVFLHTLIELLSKYSSILLTTIIVPIHNSKTDKVTNRFITEYAGLKIRWP